MASEIAQATAAAPRKCDVDSTLMLAGVSGRVAMQLEKTGALSDIGPDRVFHATRAVTESTRQAMAAAQALTGPGSPLSPGTTNPILARQSSEAGRAPRETRP